MILNIYKLQSLIDAMSHTLKTIFLSFLMIVLGLSAATNSMNESTETTTLGEPSAPQEVILPANLLNEAGHQEGSIFTDTTLSAGQSHTCAIRDNGLVSCWGSGSSGKLGTGGQGDEMTPASTNSLGTGRTAVAISSGHSHTCAILDNGAVSCWGYSSSQTASNNTYQYSPELTNSLGTGRTAVALSSGDYHTCAILNIGAVSCWGQNSKGQLGSGGTSNSNIPTLTYSFGTGRTAVALSSGDKYTCAILDNGSVSCWGWNANGQLGTGDTSNENPSPALTSSLGIGRTAVALSTGGSHTCAILDDGSVSCWGKNWYGQLGDGTTTDRLTPTQTSSLGTGRTAVAISTGYSHTCVILDNGEVSCWGTGNRGQLGHGGTSHQSSPTLTSSLGTGRTAVALSSGTTHTCAVLDNGSVSCWGNGLSGQLGSGGTSNQLTPTLTSDLGTATNPRTAALSERDFDNDGTLNIFESTPPSPVTCSPGQYGRYLCVDAPLGKYAPATGAVYATDASAGYYVPTIGQSTQTPCAIGTFQVNTGQDSCDDADAGSFVNQTGQTSQTDCAIGTYQSLTAQSSCDAADIGSYVSAVGQSTQTACPNGQSTITTGSNSSTQCISDFDNDALVDILDSDDDNDGVSDLTDLCLTADFNLTSDNDNDGCDDSDEDTDDDNDGVLDVNDDLPLDATEAIDTDGDGTGNNADMDDDGDNVTDLDDDFPLDSTESVDTDGDGMGDNADTDDDNDGVLDASDAFPLDSNESVDTDGDGIGNYADTDDDNDGVIDLNDAFPVDVSETVDTDGDGMGDNADMDDDGDNVADVNDAFPLDASESLDTDGDGIGDNVDTDDDDDSVLDIDDAFPLDSNESVDTDEDGTGDNADTDDDNDGVIDLNDAFPVDASETVDTDGDGMGDKADTDDDNDGVLDASDAFPLDSNEFVDTDGDGIGDNSDTNDAVAANDGLLPGFELWITLLAISVSLFFNRTRKII